MIKLTFLLMATMFSLNVWSQTMYEKYNNMQNRYEYFDTYGQMIGYKTYNSYTKVWSYYDLKQQVNNDMNLSETARYSGNVQAQLQARYDYNLKRIVNSVEALIYKVKVSSYSNYVKTSSGKEFAKCIEILDSKKLDMTNTSQIDQAIIWLNKSMDNIINFYVNQENNSKN